MLKIPLLVISFFLLFSAYPQQYAGHLYTVQNGLPSTYVFNSLLRKNGELIVGTANGFSRFNGNIFINYDYRSGLDNLMVHAVFEDSRERLWLGTDLGMNMFDGKKCIRYPTSDSTLPGYVFGFFEYENKLWANAHNGVYVFKDSVWYKKMRYPSSGGATQILNYKNGLLFCFKTRILFYRNKQFETLFTSKSSDLNVIHVGTDNTLYMMSRNEGVFALRNGHAEWLFKKAEHETITNMERVDNKLWIFFENKKMLELDLKTKVQKRILDVLNVQGVHQANNIIWISGYHGLLQINKAQNIRYFDIRTGTNTRFVMSNPFAPFTFVHNIRKDLFNIYDGSKVTNIPVPVSPQEADELLIDKACFSDANNLWIITRKNELININLNEQSFSKHLSGKVLYDVDFDKRANRLYVSTREKIYVLAPSGNMLDSLPYPRSFSLNCLNSGELLFYSNGKFFLKKEKKYLSV